MGRASKNYRYVVLLASWSLALLLLGALLYGVMGERASRREVLDRSLGEVLASVVLRDSLSAPECEAICRDIEAMDGVISVRSVSSGDAINDFVRITGHKPMMKIALPSSVEVRLAGGVDVVDRLSVRLKGDRRVVELVFDRGVIASREQVESGVSNAIIYLVVSVCVVVLWFVVMLTALWAGRERREIIFARVFVAGALGGLVAALLLAVVDQYLRSSLGVTWLLGEDSLLLIGSLQVLSGGMLGLVLGYILKQMSRR